MSRIRWRTSRPSESFFIRSLGLSGSREPSAHWPWPRSGRVLVRGVVTVLLPALATTAGAGPRERGAADRGDARGRAGFRLSARGVTHGAGHERQIDVQTRDEKAAAVAHGPHSPICRPA